MMQTFHDISIQRITLTMVLLSAFTTPLMLSSVNVSLPLIASEFTMNAITLSWIPMAYLMASAMFVLMFGRLADMFGRRRIFLLGIASVVITSLAAAMAVNSTMLITARFFQGVSTAMLYATQISLVSSLFSGVKRARAIGLVVSAIYLGLTIGPILGGYIIDTFGWRASFIVHIPLLIVAFIIGLVLVKHDWCSDKLSHFDLSGSMIYIFSILLLCLAVSNLPSLSGLVLLVLALLSFVYFFRFEKSSIQPILDVELFFTNRIFTFSCLASLIIYTATFANVVQVSLYLQYLKGFSATKTGLIIICQPLTMALFSPLAGRCSATIEPRYLATTGMALSFIGLCLLANLKIASTINYLICALVVTGFGFSLFSAPNVNAIMSSVEKRALASANAVVATMRIFGQMMSMVLVMLVFVLILGAVEIEISNHEKLEQAIGVTFMLAAALCLPGLYFSIARGTLK